MITMAEETGKRTRKAQKVFECKWRIDVDEKEEIVTQLVAGRDFQSAFFKARTWAKSNIAGEMVSMTRREDFVL